MHDSKVSKSLCIFIGIPLPVSTLACSTKRTRKTRVRSEALSFFLAANDLYRIQGVNEGHRGGLARLRALRVELERQHPHLLLLIAGDFLFPSLLSRLYDGKQMVDTLNYMDRSSSMDERLFVTLGNHEFDGTYARTLQDRIAESQFRWIASNVEFKPGFCK
jgi:2',3'-cyclic-nucleotide 2'-phosphodiesterase (5'-nucleotidase family)